MNLRKALVILLVAGVALVGCPSTVSVPAVTNMTQTEAETALTSAGLVVGTVTQAYSTSVEAGKVISQDPVSTTVVAAASAVNLVISQGPEPQVIVPDLSGMTVDEATTALTALGLTLGNQYPAPSTTIAEGNIINSSPAVGASVSLGSTIAIVVSSGPATVLVPDVVNIPSATAVSNIYNAELTIGAITYANSTTVASGSVISQDPASGTEALAGSTVSIVVSNGPVIVAVPSLVGKTTAEATTALNALGLVAGTPTYQYSAGTAGLVLNQGTAAGTSVAVGTTVDITVSAGVPNVKGMTKEAAITALTAIGLVCADPGNITPALTNLNAVGTVVDQAAPFGTPAVVQLTVSARTVPASSGVVFGTWQTNLLAAGLQVGNITYEVSILNIGKVKTTTPVAGTVVTSSNPKVDVTVYSGSVPSFLGYNLGQAAVIANGQFVLDPATTPFITTAKLVETLDPALVATIAQQTPAAGTAIPVNADGTFNNTVALKLYGVQVPYVVGQAEATAKATVQAVRPATAGFATVTSTVLAATKAQFATVKTEKVAAGVGAVPAPVPVTGVLTAADVVTLDVYGLDAGTLMGLDAGGKLELGVTTEANAITRVAALKTADTLQAIPYKITPVWVNAAAKGFLQAVKNNDGVAVIAADAGVKFQTALDLQIGGLMVLYNTVGKDLGANGDNVADDTAYGLLTGAALAADNKFTAADLNITRVMAPTADKIDVVLTQVPAVTTVPVVAVHPALTVGSGVIDYVAQNVRDTIVAGVVTAKGAVTLATEFGLAPTVQWLDPADCVHLNGQVESTNPTANAFVVPGQSIIIYGVGSKVPAAIIGMSYANAQAALAGATLVEGTVTGPVAGTVKSVTPAINTILEPGTAVNIVME